MALRLFKSFPDYLRKIHSEVTPGPMHKIPTKIKTEKVPVPLYGGRYLVTMLPGNGIGPEMTSHVRDVFDTAQVPVDFEIIEGTGEELVKNAITSIRRNRVAIKGNLTNVIEEDEGFIAPNVMIRTKLDLFVYFIHYKTYLNVKSVFPNIDIMLVRQNTEGEYALLEHESVKGVVESLKIVTRMNTSRLAKFAFEHARRHGRKKITVVHKSRQVEISDGLFLNTIRDAAQHYPDLKLEDIYIDQCCEKLVKNPQFFDVLLMPNLYATVVSNVICGLAGGAGLFSGVNYGEDMAVFESAIRQTGDNLVGKNIANPVAMLNAAVNMLRYLGKNEHAKLISDAIEYTLSARGIHTPDVGGNHKTTDVIHHVKQWIVWNLHKYKNKF